MLIKKIKQDLVILGYNTESISSITNNLRIDEDNSIIEKEYNKLYKKIIKKHDKEKVNNLIKYELIRKGFSIDNINNIISQKKDSIT